MPPCHPFRPVPGQCGPNRRGPLPAPPFDPRDYWATRKCVSRLSASLETKLDKADVVDPGAATEAGKAADAKSTYEELSRILAKLVKKADKATTLAGYGITDAATKAELAAKADLADGKVPAAQLPSYVDDVLEYDTMSAFPDTGESSKIYVAKDTNLVYRWSGTQYVEISPSPVLDDTVTEASSNGVKSSGIWSWVKSLLPHWLTSDYAEPATVASVAAKADKATTLAGYGITDAVPLVTDENGNKTAVTIGSRKSGESVGQYSLANGYNVTAYGSYSHAEGSGTSASGYCSHAEGENAVASGYYSHAEGLVTSASGYYSHAEGSGTSASGSYSHAEGSGTSASGYCSHAEGENAVASGDYSHAEGTKAQTLEDDRYAYAWNGDGDRAIHYSSHGQGTFNINPAGGLDGFFIGEQTLYAILTNKADKADISSTNTTFSNAVLAVGLNIDTNSVAVLNEIAETFGGFPLGAGETATTVGGLLAALAAAVAWLKKNKVQTLKLNDNSVETSADGGVAKLDDFFTESNSLLTGTIDDRLPIPISAKSAGFTTESYKRFIVTVSGDMTVTLHTPTSGDAEIFECRFNGASLSADASITFAGATATTMDANCGTVTAGKIALMSAFWNGTTWDVNWKVEG